jgi:ribosomal-protein-serine acetyltransferase
LTLRLWVPEEAELLAEAVNESIPRLIPFLPFASEEPISLEERRELILSWNERWRRGEDSFLGMFHGDMVVGSTGLHRRGADGHRVAIGYWVRSGHTGNGYATETARMLTTAAFGIPGVDVVAIHHDVANNASRRIPERLGFRRARVVSTEVLAPGQTGSEVQWEVTRDEWSSLS